MGKGGGAMNWVGQSSYLGEEIESQKIKIKNWEGDHDHLLNFRE